MKQLEVRKPKTPVSRSAIEKLGADFSVTFPEDYIEHLLRYNGGHPEKSAFPAVEVFKWADDRYPVGWRGHSIDWFCAIHAGHYSNLSESLRCRGFRAPKEFITIASLGYGDKLLLGIEAPYVGKVYVWMHEWEVPGDEEPDMENMFLAAHSFTDLINSLYGYDLLDEESYPYYSRNYFDRDCLPTLAYFSGREVAIRDFFVQAPKSVAEFFVDVEKIGSVSTNLLAWYEVDGKRVERLFPWSEATPDWIEKSNPQHPIHFQGK
jgi:hypothetical protein